MDKTPQPKFDKTANKQTIKNSEDDTIAKALDLEPLTPSEIIPSDNSVVHHDEKKENLENDYHPINKPFNFCLYVSKVHIKQNLGFFQY